MAGKSITNMRKILGNAFNQNLHKMFLITKIAKIWFPTDGTGGYA